MKSPPSRRWCPPTVSSSSTEDTACTATNRSSGTPLLRGWSSPTGASRSVTGVPDVVGRQLGQAQALMRKAGLVGVAYEPDAPSAGPSGQRCQVDAEQPGRRRHPQGVGAGGGLEVAVDLAGDLGASHDWLR